MTNTYIHTEYIHNLNAPREVVPIIMELINPKSVLDVGCGTGTWLKVFAENGVENYLGVDGDFVDKNQIKIPLSKFKVHDLRQDLKLDTKFDLVISLEVAEHLPESCAYDFVNSLVRHGEVIVFSAAIPRQGGQNHLNEQWPEYWREKFEIHGYYFHDIIRPLIWDNEKIEWWYRQNIFLIIKRKSSDLILNCYHPECFKEHSDRLTGFNDDARYGRLGIRESLKILLRSVRNLLKKFP